MAVLPADVLLGGASERRPQERQAALQRPGPLTTSRNNNIISHLLQAFINQMRSLCVVRVAFNHSWGTKEMPKIYNTPCWVEIYMNR